MNWPPDFSTLNDRLCEAEERRDRGVTGLLDAVSVAHNISVTYLLGYAGNHGRQSDHELADWYERRRAYGTRVHREMERLWPEIATTVGRCAALRRTLAHVVTMALGKPPKVPDLAAAMSAEPVRFTYGDVVS